MDKGAFNQTFAEPASRSVDWLGKQRAAAPRDLMKEAGFLASN